eukprot:gene11235-biopygen11530
MKYESLVLAPALSYLHDMECNATLDASEDGELSYEDLQNRIHAVTNSVHSVYAMLCNLWTMLELRRQWSKSRGLRNVEAQMLRCTRYIRGEANVWANNFSRYEDLDDGRLNRKWFVWVSEQWGPFTVDRFASEISARLPRYYAAWKDPRCEGVDSLAYDWRGENNWVNPPWALLEEVVHKLREEGAAATVMAPYWPGQSWFRELEALATEEFNEDGKAHVLYDDGDEETLDLSEENFKIIGSSGMSEPTDEAADADGKDIDRRGDYKENKRGGAVENFLTRPLSTEATVLLYIAFVMKDGGIKSASLQPYLSAINNYHEDLRFPGSAKGRAVTRAVKGMATIQAELAVQEENIETRRTWLPGERTPAPPGEEALVHSLELLG